jgi:hypothetical protein
MIAVLLTLCVIDALLWLVVIADLVAPIIGEWRRRRQVVRNSAAAQQLRALRAAHELSLHVWRARHELYDLAEKARRSDLDDNVIRK